MSSTSPAGPPLPFYNKPWMSHRAQVALIQSRGVGIGDPDAAEEFLSHVNYYRLSGYFLSFETSRHKYPPGVTFEMVRGAYEFDRNLRDLVTEALEVVEVDFRTSIAHQLGQKHGAYAHSLPGNFQHTFGHATWIAKISEEVERSSEAFVEHFRATYDGFPSLPVWVVTEVMSFGCLSRMFAGMRPHDQQAVASRYGVTKDHLASWMHHCCYIRNLCAHHSRLWDRVWSIKPSVPMLKKEWRTPFLPKNDRLFVHLLILRCLLTRCPGMVQFANEWRDRVNTLIAQPPQVADPLWQMGLTPEWAEHPFWADPEEPPAPA